MDWDKIKESLFSVYKEAAYYIENMPRLHLLGCMLLLMTFCTRQPEPEVRIVLENNGPPVIIKEVKTIEVVHKEPIITKPMADKAISFTSTKSNQHTAEGLKVGDCLTSYTTAQAIERNKGTADWEKESIGYVKITKIGKTMYKYHNWSDGQWDTDNPDIGEIYHLNYINVKTECPDVS